MRLKYYIFLYAIIGVAVTIYGCGEPYRMEADQYVTAARSVLIAKGLCATPEDCRSKELIFWNDGEHLLDIFPKDVTFVNIYNTQDPAIVNAIVAELKKTQERISKPGVVLNVYKSKHRETDVKYQRVVIK
jgi:hypothetical protein